VENSLLFYSFLKEIVAVLGQKKSGIVALVNTTIKKSWGSKKGKKEDNLYKNHMAFNQGLKS
jgi:hypothetical protein